MVIESIWQPSASLPALKARAQLLAAVRAFFAQREVLEVEAPLLCQAPASAPHLHSFVVQCSPTEARYLQTSPEYALKRLIAAYAVPVYYLGKAFRANEVGGRHNPEFTLLEWYRPHWDHFQLMAETDELLRALLGTEPASTTTYAALFEQYLQLDPHVAEVAQLKEIAWRHQWVERSSSLILDKDGWLDLLFTHGIEPEIGFEAPLMVVDFPGSQASLAKTHVIEAKAPYEVAERFEVYYRGLELANGYHELACPKELRDRFGQDLKKRQALHLPAVPIDENLLAALEAGFPPCAGIALGFDRLLMLKLGARDLRQVLLLAWEQA